MKTNFYFNGRKVTRKEAEQIVGKERLANMIEDAKADFMEDPIIQNSFMAPGGIITIEFA